MSEKEYDPNIITVTDEYGKEHEFEELDRIETEDGGHYVALLPVYDSSEEMLEDDGELIILSVNEAEDGEIYLEPIEDEEKFDEIGSIFKDRLKDIFEFDGEE